MRHSSLVFLPLALVFPPIITSGCGSSDPIVSSSSHWLTCRSFSDCAVTEEAVACEQGYCVDAEDKRIEIPEASVGGSSSGGRDGQDPGTGGTASSAGGNGAVTGGSSSGGLGQGGDGPTGPLCDEELLDVPGLSDSPRDDRNLEELSLLAVTEIAVDDASYERVVRDVSAIRELSPEVAEIGYRSNYEEGLTVMFESDADLLRVEEGDYHDWDCVNDALGAEVEVIRFDSIDIAYASITFDKVIDQAQVAAIYQEFPGVSQADHSSTLGDGSSICLLPGEDAWHYVFDDASGDCPAGCINHVYYYFEVDESGAIESGEAWAIDVGEPDTGRPDWVELFEEAGQFSGNRFCMPGPQ